MQTITAVLPTVGIIKKEKKKMQRNLSLTLAEVINDATSSLNGLQISLNLLVQVTMDIALDFFLATNDGNYSTASISLSIWINETDKVEQAISHLENSAWQRLSLNP